MTRLRKLRNFIQSAWYWKTIRHRELDLCKGCGHLVLDKFWDDDSAHGTGCELFTSKKP